MVLTEAQKKKCQQFILDVKGSCGGTLSLTLDKIIADNYDRNAELIEGNFFLKSLVKLCKQDEVLTKTIKTGINELIVWVIFYLMRKSESSP